MVVFEFRESCVHKPFWKDADLWGVNWSSRAFIPGCLFVDCSETVSWEILSCGIKTEVGVFLAWSGIEHRLWCCGRDSAPPRQPLPPGASSRHRMKQHKPYFLPTLIEWTLKHPFSSVEGGSTSVTSAAGRGVWRIGIKEHLAWVLFPTPIHSLVPLRD